MKQFARMDVSLREVTICIVDETGMTVPRRRIPSDHAGGSVGMGRCTSGAKRPTGCAQYLGRANG